MTNPRASDIELIASNFTPADDGAGSIVVPREVRINGVSVYTGGDGAVRIGTINLGKGLVTVNLTLVARSLRIAAEPAEDDQPAAEDTVDAGQLVDTVRRVLGINPADGPADVVGWLLLACRELEKSEAAREHLLEERAEARQWARHGYEIGQKHCGWTDHGVAPRWLTEGWPASFDGCEHLVYASTLDEALTRVRNLPTEPEAMDAQQKHPEVWRHGYHCGVLAARSAARPRNEETTKP